jgi:DNA-binding winged helix-turn-helix (wHTH) protein
MEDGGASHQELEDHPLIFAFESFELDPVRRRLRASGEPVSISDRQFDVLSLLVARAGQIISKDDLIHAGWKDVAVGDNSIEQAISSLRRLLAIDARAIPYIETVARRGYRFTAAVTRTATRESDAALDALLAPQRAFIEGRAALETLEADRVAKARGVFEDALCAAPEYAPAHVGLANACIMQFEMTRTDRAPDMAALGLAALHAREACRLDPGSAEAWATLGFVLDRTGDRRDATAASRRAITLEPDNWRHHFRLSYVSWGEDRLRAAHGTLALLPHFQLAHWLAATVHVARNALDSADRELVAGLAPQGSHPADGSRFGAVALHWLSGLIRLSRGEEAQALEEFERELRLENAGQLYARECAANTWYAIGALKLRQGRSSDAAAAFTQAIERVATHPMAHVGLAAANGSGSIALPGLHNGASLAAQGTRSVYGALVQAARLSLAGAHAEAARALEDALAQAPAGNAAWLLPVEPLLHVTAHPDVWARALAHVRNRAS